MATEKGREQESFDARVLAAVESNDLTLLRNLLNQRSAEGPNAFLYANLSNSLNRALELSRYSIASELFQRGATWNYETIAYVLEGARADNDWNTKAVDLALEHGWTSTNTTNMSAARLSTPSVYQIEARHILTATLSVSKWLRICCLRAQT